MIPCTVETITVVEPKLLLKESKNETRVKSEPIEPSTKYKTIFGEFETEVKWINVISIGLIHLLNLYGLIMFPFSQKIGLLLYQLFVATIAGFGVTGGVHRYWTHRSYKAKLPLKLILLFCYAVAGQNTILEWVKDHRVHHKFSETDADPHNAKRGFFFSHIGWLMMKKHPDVIQKGKAFDCSDITEDPVVKVYTKYFGIIKLFCCMLIPMAIPCYFWGEPLYYAFFSSLNRFLFTLHATWSVNSVAHFWGNKPFDRNIKPTENWKVSMVALGEGWHNYHHTFPWDYKAAELGQYLNVTTLLLDFFASIGWAYDLKSATPEMVLKMTEKHGDGSHHHLHSH